MPRYKTTTEVIDDIFRDLTDYYRAGKHLYEPDIFDDTPEIIAQARTVRDGVHDEEGA